MSDIPTQPGPVTQLPSGNDATRYANTIMSQMLGYASRAVENANELEITVDDSDIEAVQVPTIVSSEIDFSRALDVLNELLANVPDEPDFGEINQEVPDRPALNENPPDTTSVIIPDFTGNAPDIKVHDAPSLKEYPIPTGEPPNWPGGPDRPDMPIPAFNEGSLLTLDLPSPAAITIPNFDSTLLDENLITPSNNFNFSEEDYTSDILTALKDGILDDIVNGDYGLEPDDESRLFERARDRELKNTARLTEEAVRPYSLSGFPMPPGAMLGAIAEAEQESVDRTSTINRDLTLQRADRYADFKKFMFDKGLQLENMLITLHSATMERALNAQKAQADVAVSFFNAQVAGFVARQQRHLVNAQVFETIVKAELGKIEIYKAQLSAEELKTNVNKNTVEIYAQRLEAVQKAINIYKTDVEAVNILSEQEARKIEVLRAETEVFVELTRANKLEFEAYEASLRGESLKSEAYKAEAGAYGEVIRGKVAQVEANKFILQEFMERNKALIDVYRVEADYYKDIRDAQTSYRDGQVSVFDSQVRAFSAEMSALTAATSLEIEAAEKEYRAQLLQLQADVEVSKVQLEKVVSIARFQTDVFKAKNQTYTAIGASSLSAMNVNVAIRTAATEAFNRSIQESYASSNRSNWGESHVHDETKSIPQG